MKKLYGVILLVVVILGACSDNNQEGAKKEVRFPAYFYEGLTEDEIKADAKESGATRAEFLEDGTVVYYFTEKAWQKKFDDIEASLDEYLKDVAVNETYPSIVNASANKDYSNLTFVVNKAAYENSQDYLAIIGIGISATYYQLFLDKEELKVSAKVIDSVTAESVDTMVFPDDVQK